MEQEARKHLITNYLTRMKKVLFLMVAFAMSISFMSCKNEAGKDAASAEQKSTTENVEQKVDLVELVAKVKAEGANWSVDQWKDAFKSALIALKPMMETMSEFQAKLKGAKEEDAAKIMSELEAKSKEFEPIEKAMAEFEEAAKATENGKKVLDDEEWGKQMMKELGFPEDMGI